ncbi:hypothetical protein B0J18DRAFT_398954 [Chaetomium sp. MPI-SDFR-AT-0129]|nr:hypothetical protein B0J18DRAFT_398954 [Chaetomium sp. MPI-SDFR-AT-0129]
MPKHEIYHLHPLNWESDPEEERWKLSTLDYLASSSYLNYALYFQLDNHDTHAQSKALAALRHGLERTLSQARHLCSTLERDPDGDGYSFVHKKDDTVEFHVQWLDRPEDAERFPSLQGLERAHFRAAAMGSHPDLWRIPHMSYGSDNPTADLDRHPAVFGVKASFIRGGGLVLVTHLHHLANDLSGWVGCMQQLADNCRAVATEDGASYPPWDSACLDASSVTRPPVPEDKKVDVPENMLWGPETATSLPGGRQLLLFHLPKSKAAELKASAQPGASTNSGVSHISTYDAVVAQIWRSITKTRHPHYADQIPTSTPLLWIQILDMRARLNAASSSVTYPPRMQRNILSVGISTMPIPGGPPAPTVAEVMGKPLSGINTEPGQIAQKKPWPLSHLASYIRANTSVFGTPAVLDGMLDQVAAIRQKRRATANLHAMPALAVMVSDHRAAGKLFNGVNGRGHGGEGKVDFGFGEVVAYRQLWGRVDIGIVIIYPPRKENEGYEVSIGYEKVLAKELVEDEEWSRWFEFRGVDWED